MYLMPDIVNDIKSMKIRSSKTIAVSSLRFLLDFAKKNGFGSRFNEKVSQLESARPTTTVMLRNVLENIKKEPSIKKINDAIQRIESMQDGINKNASVLHGKIMIHCNSTELDKAVIANKSRIKEVFVTDTGPRKQGLLSAKELRAAGIKIKYITDSAAGYYMQDVDMVAVGADAITQNGIVNKIGTLLMAVAADAFSRPFYVIADTMKYHNGKVKIEYRDPLEVTKKLPGSVILNPGFDVTPWRYVTAVVTDQGVKKPLQVMKELRNV